MGIGESKNVITREKAITSSRMLPQRGKNIHVAQDNPLRIIPKEQTISSDSNFDDYSKTSFLLKIRDTFSS